MSEDAADKTHATWDVPTIDAQGGAYATAGGLEELQKEAYEEAWQTGHAEGARRTF